ncbi:RNA chaperone ProQ [Vibrio sp. SS-MA-C1-2]|uniref:RNA chaperone ProQ n=1 Tax=Vibrio sp. SS-MA-C1-2 TaxID=2908646 RepID=UPI001F28BB9D|nr:RNA chaperone ProQ [Vibrio sp. SS-MA-C1-2]UJF18083.1 RNA chaperone ProQ [Vibrio sp. SS-MA-C1-2]
MENTEKLTNSKAVITYVATIFPKCFIMEGEAKPLKIGIFQDLATRLADDEKVSKTQLRAALRQYTSSWRYLHGVKPGAQRIDLDGNDCGELEAEHIEHAQKALAESKAKVQERRKEKAAAERAVRKEKSDAAKAKAKKAKQIKEKTAKLTSKPAPIVTREIKKEEVILDREVKVNMGKGDMPATIVEIQKDGVRVRLANGLVMLVKQEHLRL